LFSGDRQKHERTVWMIQFIAKLPSEMPQKHQIIWWFWKKVLSLHANSLSMEYLHAPGACPHGCLRNKL